MNQQENHCNVAICGKLPKYYITHLGGNIKLYLSPLLRKDMVPPGVQSEEDTFWLAICCLQKVIWLMEIWNWLIFTRSRFAFFFLPFFLLSIVFVRVCATGLLFCAFHIYRYICTLDIKLVSACNWKNSKEGPYFDICTYFV